MKLYLPHREATLDTSLGFTERNEEIYKLLEESTGLQDNENDIMSVEEYFRFTWDKQPTKISLDVIGYYLTKNNAEGEDRDVLSNGKQKEMIKGSNRHTTFSGMGYDNQVAIGVVDTDDYCG
ncbi:hypothetical protein [Bacillus sp. FJAT-22090]|uniref:hypothetical protein n=1 Tax=Bacillus sp. FJAT-22090 TaxID=1581038 RepID=UPI0011A0B53D|nr:hypothetical protein [Bacillus sp. FJAT-22090]